MVLGIVCLLPQDAMADVGIPMIVFTLPGMVMVLIPVIFLEMLVMKPRLSVSTKTALKVSSVANIVTTIVGIPFTWLVLVIIQFWTGGGGNAVPKTPIDAVFAVTLHAAWRGEGPPYWVIPAAAMWLLVPSFFVSWWLEYKVAARMLPDAGRQQLKSAMFRANLLSYYFLEMIALGWLVYEIVFEL